MPKEVTYEPFPAFFGRYAWYGSLGTPAEGTLPECLYAKLPPTGLTDSCGAGVAYRSRQDALDALKKAQEPEVTLESRDPSCTHTWYTRTGHWDYSDSTSIPDDVFARLQGGTLSPCGYRAYPSSQAALDALRAVWYPETVTIYADTGTYIAQSYQEALKGLKPPMMPMSLTVFKGTFGWRCGSCLGPTPEEAVSNYRKALVPKIISVTIESNGRKGTGKDEAEARKNLGMTAEEKIDATESCVSVGVLDASASASASAPTLKAAIEALGAML